MYEEFTDDDEIDGTYDIDDADSDTSYERGKKLNTCLMVS